MHSIQSLRPVAHSASRSPVQNLGPKLVSVRFSRGENRTDTNFSLIARRSTPGSGARGAAESDGVCRAAAAPSCAPNAGEPLRLLPPPHCMHATDLAGNWKQTQAHRRGPDGGDGTSVLILVRAGLEAQGAAAALAKG